MSYDYFIEKFKKHVVHGLSIDSSLPLLKQHTPGVRNVLPSREHMPADVFTTRRYASAVLAVIVCLSVRPSVCLSQVGVVQRWLNLGSD